MAGYGAAARARTDGASRPILRLAGQPAALAADLGPIRTRAIRHGLSVVGVLVLGLLYWVGRDPGYDAYGYWRAIQGDPYGVATGLGAFHYSPVFLLATSPFGAVDWPEFYWLIAGLSFGALLWLGRWWVLALLAFVPIASEIYHGNVDILIAAAIVAGLRWPAAWSFVLLTKITPGVGLLWFAVRREWRSLAVAAGATAALAIPTVALRPDLWSAWIAHLQATGAPSDALAVPIPLPIRLAAAALLIAWGARTDRRWTVVVGATIAQPILGIIGFSMLAGLAGVAGLRRSEGGSSWRLPPITGPFGLVTTGCLLLVVSLLVLPVLVQEEVRDWRTYAAAGERLGAGLPLYVVGGRVEFIYPPPIALLWSLGLTEPAWLTIKLVCLLGIAAMVRGWVRPVLIGLTLLAAPVQHDLVIGNVMVIYVGAVGLLLGRGGWPGATALGLVLAFAAKPVIGPFLLALALVRRADVVRVLGVAAGASLVAALVVGPGRYAEYVAALPLIPGSLEGFLEGNLGLGRRGPIPALGGFAFAYLATVVVAVRGHPDLALPVGLAAGMLAQPTIPFYYAALLVPAIVLLWRQDPVAALALAFTTPILSIFSPVVAAVSFLLVLAGRAWARRSAAASQGASAVPQTLTEVQ